MCFFYLKTSNNTLTVQNVQKSTKSPHFPLRGSVGQLRKRKRVFCWSIYLFSLCPKVLAKTKTTFQIILENAKLKISNEIMSFKIKMISYFICIMNVRFKFNNCSYVFFQSYSSFFGKLLSFYS